MGVAAAGNAIALKLKGGRYRWAEPVLASASLLWVIVPVIVYKVFDLDAFIHAVGTDLSIQIWLALIFMAPICNLTGVVIGSARFRIDGKLRWPHWIALTFNALSLAYLLFGAAKIFELID